MKKLVVLALVFCAIGCADLVVSSAEKKKATFEQTSLAKEANDYFWDHFHAGDYDSIPIVTAKLSQALSENPTDLRTTAHLGFVHIWALSERQRLEHPNPLIVDNLYVARRFFEEAYNMNEADPRILGFLANMTLAEGSTLHNAKEQTQGYFMGLKSVKEWPQFNKFTVGYAFSRLAPSDKNFKQGLKWQYETVNDCACGLNPSSGLSDKQIIESMNSCGTEKVRRACGNTWIAPHNLEGFLLNFGDMLVKDGQWKEATRIYQMAKYSNTFDKWIYKDVLEDRIQHAKEYTEAFNQPLREADLHNQTVLMVNSKFSCMGCHGMSREEQATFAYQVPPARYYFLKDTLR